MVHRYIINNWESQDEPEHLRTRLTEEGDRAAQKFQSKQLDALLLAMQAGQDLKKQVKDERNVAEYQTIAPLCALLNILVNIQERNQFNSNQTKVNLSFSPDGTLIASKGEDGTVKLWRQNGMVRTLSGHKDKVTCATFSPDGTLIASGSQDGTLQLWKLDGTLINTFSTHKGTIAISFGPNGTIASGSQDGTVQLWKLDGTLITTFSTPSHSVTSISFSPDGNIIAFGSDDKTINLWKPDGTLITTLKANTLLVTSLSFSSDGKIIAVGSDDGTIKLWKRDGTLITTLTGHGNAVTNVSFSRDGTITSVGKDGRVILWSLNLDDLLARGCQWLQDYFVTHPEALKTLKVCGSIRADSIGSMSTL